MYYLKQPDFLNAVVKIKTDLDPEGLLDFLKATEKHFKREQQEQKYMPRTLDLDILVYDNELVYNSPRLTLPHPKIFERDFVLFPLADLDESLEIPG